MKGGNVSRYTISDLSILLKANFNSNQTGTDSNLYIRTDSLRCVRKISHSDNSSLAFVRPRVKVGHIAGLITGICATLKLRRAADNVRVHGGR